MVYRPLKVTVQRDDIHEKQGRIYIPRVKGSIAKTYPRNRWTSGAGPIWETGG